MDDSEARDGLIESRVRDAYACLRVLDGAVLASDVAEAAELFATVVGQDIEPADDGTLRIIRGVAKDRVISTVDVDARHGRKTTAHRFDGCKGHIAIDPDPAIVINRPRQPIFEPKEEWELHGDVPNVVFSSANPVVEGTVHVYYGAADRVIGLATTPLKDLIEFAHFG